MKEKLIASFLAALMVFAPTALAATALKDYPNFLATSGHVLDAYVVVGSQAATADVVGAIDLALRLTELSYTVQTVSGTVGGAVNGLEKDTFNANFGNLTDLFANPVRTFHYSNLKQGQIVWKGTNYDYHEQINLSVSTSKAYFSHDYGTAGINGTEKMVVPAGVIAYEYSFDKTLNITSATGNGRIGGTPEYTYPVNINLLGQPFSIVAAGSNQVKMLSGSTGTATSTQGVTYGNYTVYAILGGTTFLRVAVKDSAGNTVEEDLIQNVPNSVDTTMTSPVLTIKATSIAALVDGTVVGAYLIVGPQGAIEKTYTTSCDITGTGTADVKFPGSDKWCIQTVGFVTDGQITSGDKIQVIYKPTTQPEYFGAGTALALPNNYGDVGFEGFNKNTVATLTFTPKAGLTGYYLTGVGTTNATIAASSLNGIEISSDVAGTLVSGSTGYAKVYILFGVANAVDPKYPVYMGLYDSVNNRIGIDPTNTYATAKVLNSTNIVPASSYALINFTVSYGSGAAVADQQTIVTNITVVDAAVLASGGTGTSIFKVFRIDSTTPAVTGAVSLNFYNKTATWSTTSAPELRLYTSDNADAKDVQVKSTDTSGTQNTADVGLSSQDVVADGGEIVVAPASNSAGQTAVVKIPAQALYVKAYVGKLAGATTGGASTYNQIVPITTPVAKLDTDAEMLAGGSGRSKNLITVGGPCINTITAAALGLTYPACGAASTIPSDKAIIQVVDDVLATGKKVVVVAGWEATNTRTACSVLQQYGALLSGVTASKVVVTAATTAGITPA